MDAIIFHNLLRNQIMAMRVLRFYSKLDEIGQFKIAMHTTNSGADWMTSFAIEDRDDCPKYVVEIKVSIPKRMYFLVGHITMPKTN